MTHFVLIFMITLVPCIMLNVRYRSTCRVNVYIYMCVRREHTHIYHIYTLVYNRF